MIPPVDHIRAEFDVATAQRKRGAWRAAASRCNTVSRDIIRVCGQMGEVRDLPRPPFGSEINPLWRFSAPAVRMTNELTDSRRSY